MILGIDCSRIRSGGGVAHIRGLLSNVDPVEFGVTEVHLWAHHDLVNTLPVFPWLKKHSPKAVNSGLIVQVMWQAFKLKLELKKARCDVLLSTFAGNFCDFSPAIVISHDMLSYEPAQLRRYGWTKNGLRLLLLLFIQNRAFRRSTGVIFLTQYAAHTIQRSTGRLPNYRIIPHGVDESFRLSDRRNPIGEYSLESRIRCIYISTIAVYKNQDTVVKAIRALRSRGYDITIDLIGPDDGTGNRSLFDLIRSVDPKNIFISFLGPCPHHELPEIISNADFFIFASSCENMPVTLIEGMASGIPIVCSDAGPMPEVLKGGGVYFDTRSPHSLAHALERLIVDKALRVACTNDAKTEAANYSWERTAKETFNYIRDVEQASQASSTP